MRGPPKARRFPFAPLLTALGSPTHRSIAEELGVQTRTVHHYAHFGLTLMKADEVACRFGLHPAFVWPEWLEDVPA